MKSFCGKSLPSFLIICMMIGSSLCQEYALDKEAAKMLEDQSKYNHKVFDGTFQPTIFSDKPSPFFCFGEWQQAEMHQLAPLGEQSARHWILRVENQEAWETTGINDIKLYHGIQFADLGANARILDFHPEIHADASKLSILVMRLFLNSDKYMSGAGTFLPSLQKEVIDYQTLTVAIKFHGINRVVHKAGPESCSNLLGFIKFQCQTTTQDIAGGYHVAELETAQLYLQSYASEIAKKFLPTIRYSVGGGTEACPHLPDNWYENLS